MSHFRRRLFARHQRGRRRRSRLGQLPLRQQNNLLRGLIARRARIVHDDRVRALVTARHEAEAKSPSVEAIVTAFLGPLLRRLIWQRSRLAVFGSLASQLDVLHFINARRLALPKAPSRLICRGYMFLICAMVQGMSATGRIEQLSRGLAARTTSRGRCTNWCRSSARLRALASPPR